MQRPFAREAHHRENEAVLVIWYIGSLRPVESVYSLALKLRAVNSAEQSSNFIFG